MNRNIHSTLTKFRSEEDGSATIMGISFFMTAAIIIGLSLDQANAWRNQTQIQIAADAAALAGSANLSDQTQARAIALQTARLNLGETASITAEDIELGHFDPDTFAFVAGVDETGTLNAVQVNASRSTDRSNAVPTYLLKLIGQDNFDVAAQSVAAVQSNIGGGGFAGCEDAMFLTENTVQTGGGITLDGAVCIHGEQGVHTGGGDYYHPDARLSAVNLEDITLNHYQNQDEVPPNRIKVARHMEPVILPHLNDMKAALWSELWDSGASEYDGDLLPDFIGEGSPAKIVRIDGWWSVQPGDLEENTIYVVNGGVGLSGGVDGDNLAIIAQGQIGVGGGPDLSFDNVFFMGTQLNLAGNINYGNPDDVCADDEYTVYLLGTQSLSLGGWSPGTQTSGVVGVAPTFRPGGAMHATGVYFEASQQMQLGGAINVTPCGTGRSSYYDIADTALPVGGGSGGAYLLR